MYKRYKRLISLCIVIFMFLTDMSVIRTVANEVSQEETKVLVNIDNPVNNSTLTGDVFVKGWAFSDTAIEKVEIFIGEKLHGQAVYGINRSDIKKKYPDSKFSEMSGYTYKLRGLKDGEYNIKVVATDEAGKTAEKLTTIKVNNTKNDITGYNKSILSPQQMIKRVEVVNTTKNYGYIHNFVHTLVEEAQIENVRADILFSQIMHETGYLKFNGDVKESQNNFAGLGATGNGNPGLSFPNMRIGIRAVVQHLKAYANSEKTIMEIVDPRFKYVTRGSAPYVEYLGINENPNGLGWAVSPQYGYKILSILNDTKAISIQSEVSKISSFKVEGESVVGEKLKLNTTSDKNGTLVEYTVKNKSTGAVEVIKSLDSAHTYEWELKSPGSYTISSKIKHKYSDNEYDDLKTYDVQVKASGELPEAVVSKIEVKGNTIIDSPLTISASANSVNGAYYKIYIRDNSTGVWTRLTTMGSANNVTWIPKKAGSYRVGVYTKDVKSTKEYDDIKYYDFTITGAAASITKITTTGDLIVNNTLNISASASSVNGAYYKIYIRENSTGIWTKLTSMSSASNVNWTPKKEGGYRIAVYAKDIKSTKEYDDIKYLDIVINGGSATITNITVTGDRVVNKPLKISASATSNNGAYYKIYIRENSTGMWTKLTSMGTANSVMWTPKKEGNYRVAVYTKDIKSTKEYDDIKYYDLSIESGAKATVSSITVTGKTVVNNKVTISASATSTNGAYYKFYIRDNSTGTWTRLTSMSAASSVDWTPIKAGSYRVGVYVKDIKSKNEHDDIKYYDFTVVEDIKINANSLYLSGVYQSGRRLSVIANGSSTNGVLYKYYLVDQETGKWTLIHNYTTKDKVTFTIPTEGKFSIIVYLKDKLSKSEYDARLERTFETRTKTIVIDPGHGGSDPGAIGKHNGNQYKESFYNLQLALLLKNKLENKGYRVIMTRSSESQTVDLVQRSNIANAEPASLFISIHHDSFTSSSANGLSTHYSTWRPYIDNDGIVTDSNGVKTDETPMEAAIISADISARIADSASKAVGYYNRGKSDHNLSVTRLTTMPSLLVECGFISSPIDILNITNSFKQELLMQSIYNEIVSTVK